MISRGAAELRDIFTTVENTLRKESTLSNELFDSRFGEFKNLDYKKMSDNDIFWKLVYVTFYSGFRAANVSQRLPQIKKYLYDFKKVKEFSEKEIEQIMKDPQTIHNEKKIKACIENAKEFYKIVLEHGSFSKFIEIFGDSDKLETLNKLQEDLKGRFYYLGERTVYHLLTDLGFNVLKPDRVICRIFSRLELIEDENELLQAIETGRKFSSATEHPIRCIDIIFVKYGQKGEDPHLGLKDGICLEKNPKCEKCGITKYCKYYKTN